jgi:hypothetical protein
MTHDLALEVSRLVEDARKWSKLFRDIDHCEIESICINTADGEGLIVKAGEPLFVELVNQSQIYSSKALAHVEKTIESL